MKTEELWKILNNVNFWLDYAERKNLSITTLLGIGTVLSILFEHLEILSKGDKNWLLFAGFSGILISLMTAMLTFFPRYIRSEVRVEQSKNSNSDRNPLYYGDIALFPKEEYIRTLKQYMDVAKFSALEEALIDQIISFPRRSLVS